MDAESRVLTGCRRLDPGIVRDTVTVLSCWFQMVSEFVLPLSISARDGLIQHLSQGPAAHCLSHPDIVRGEVPYSENPIRVPCLYGGSSLD